VDSFTPRRPRVFRDRANPLTDLDDVEFRARFRVTKRCFADLLATLEPGLKHTTDSHGGLLPIHQLAVALRFYASGSFLVSLFRPLVILLCINNLVSMAVIRLVNAEVICDQLRCWESGHVVARPK